MIKCIYCLGIFVYIVVLSANITCFFPVPSICATVGAQTKCQVSPTRPLTEEDVTC